MKKVTIIADTPSLFRTVQKVYGQSAVPDYAAIYACAQEMGKVFSALAFLNDGVSPRFARCLEFACFRPVFPHAPDVDEAAIAATVRLYSLTDCLVLCTHDGDYIPVVELMKAKGVEIVLCAIRPRCHNRLLWLADRFVELPVMARAAAGVVARLPLAA